jgi:hypothetical protein
LIISYSGFNDIDGPLGADPRPGYPFNYAVFESNPLFESDIRNYPSMTFLLYGSNLMRYFFPRYFVDSFVRMSELRKAVGYRSEKWEKEIANRYVDNMIKSQKIAQTFGAEFIAFLQPALFYKKSINDAEKVYLDSDRQVSALRIRDSILQEIIKRQEKEPFLFYDFSGIFGDSSEKVFKDNVHIQSQFRPAISEKIYTHIVDLLREHPEIPLSLECRAN